jgi:hypothetical protein
MAAEELPFPAELVVIDVFGAESEPLDGGGARGLGVMNPT